MGLDLGDVGVVELAGLVRRGELSATEAVSAAIEAIEGRDRHLGAVVCPLFDRALAQARASTDGQPRPFAGVPMLLKDAGQELAGTPHWVGVPALRDAGHVSTATTTLAAAFERLGFLVVGKSAVPELSVGVTTEPPGFAPTRNPWALDRTAGGSSGGSAAAVAAGLVPIAHGSDGSGSLRFPASCCGLVTIKPTAGRIPSLPPAGQPDPDGLWCDFVLARRTADLAAVFGALSPVGAERDGRPERLRVGLLPDDPLLGVPPDPSCVAAVEQAGALLAELGHEVDHSWPAALAELPHLAGPMGTVVDHLRAAQVRWVRGRLGRPLAPGDLSTEALDAAERGQGLDAAAVGRASAAIRRALAPVADWWRTHDVLVTPAMRRPPWPLGRRAGPRECGLFAAPFSFTGQPALVAPLSCDPDGLPVGVQLVARRHADELLLDLGRVLEDATGWATRRPPPVPTG